MLSEKEKINGNEIIIFILSSLIGVDTLALANQIGTAAYQDAWLCIIIASIYPLFLIFIISKILPLCEDKTIVDLNKELFGNKFGSLLNVIFSFQFLFYTVHLTSKLVFVNKTFISLFINPIKICLVLCILIAFTASRGFKTIIRSCIIIFIFLLLLLVISSLSLKYGTILNFKPILGSGFKSILVGTLKSTYYYTPLEFLLVINPYVKQDSKNFIAKNSFIAIFFSVLIYLWIIFVNIYKLGIGLVLKAPWSFVFAVQNINVPIFNSFRYVFLLLWNPNAIITIVINLFIFCEIISKTFNINPKILYYILFPLLYIFSYILFLSPISPIVLQFIAPMFIILNLINFITVLFLLKRKNQSQKSLQN